MYQMSVPSYCKEEMLFTDLIQGKTLGCFMFETVIPRITINIDEQVRFFFFFVFS